LSSGTTNAISSIDSPSHISPPIAEADNDSADATDSEFLPSRSSSMRRAFAGSISFLNNPIKNAALSASSSTASGSAADSAREFNIIKLNRFGIVFAENQMIDFIIFHFDLESYRICHSVSSIVQVLTKIAFW
jgi:hypothetical protein